MSPCIVHNAFTCNTIARPVYVGITSNDYAVALLRAGKVDRAIAEFLVGLENDPESPFLHKNLAAAYARKGQYKQALVHAREAARMDPSVRWSL